MGQGACRMQQNTAQVGGFYSDAGQWSDIKLVGQQKTMFFNMKALSFVTALEHPKCLVRAMVYIRKLVFLYHRK